MTAFLFACAGLVLFSGLFYLFPRTAPRRAEEDLTRANLDWFRRRREELADEDEALFEDAELRLLEDEEQAAPATGAVQGGAGFPLWSLLLFVALFSAALYYKLGAAPDVMINRQMMSLGPDSSETDMEALISRIEQRAAQRPDNLHYAALLGRFYMGRQDYQRAAETYGYLAREAPGDAQALAYASQSEYLAAGRQLTERSQMLAERALAVDPHQRTALGLLGMASFETGQYRAAIEYWQRLLAVEQPGSESAQMIESVLGMARERLGEEPAATAETPAAVAATAAAGVTVTVSLPEGAEVDPSASVFVLARGANASSRMPVAVRRLSAAQLPMTLRLDDSNSMAGQKLSEAGEVKVFVQVSSNGQPGESNASWLGEAGPLLPSTDNQPIDIELQPR